VLNDFLDYNDFLDAVDIAAAEPEFEDAFQVASLHPHYQFSGTQPDNIENYTTARPIQPCTYCVKPAWIALSMLSPMRIELPMSILKPLKN